MSDVGADPEVAFDDLGNAVRRIREDFGIEIEIDLSPLVPGADGLAREHMVVGTIHYDAPPADKTSGQKNGGACANDKDTDDRGLNDRETGDKRATDKGILLYFKPALTGDEPADVRQYKSRNTAFPNETTVDQFYDEAQWEAYRRLGQHAARAALDFIGDRWIANGDCSADEVFVQARWKWYPTPPEIPANALELTNRYLQLEERLRATAPPQLLAEIFPEIPIKPDAAAWTFDSIANSIHGLLELIQVMEDTYFGCQLEDHWNHPLNSGWANTFRRWGGAPIFQYWWPLLKGMYTNRFREFIDGQIQMNVAPDPLRISDKACDWSGLPDGLAKTRAPRKFGTGNFEYWCGNLKFPGLAPLDQDLQICLLRFKKTEDQTAWTWTFDDLFVLPHLRGLRLDEQFLKCLIEKARTTTPPPRLLIVTPPDGSPNYWRGSAADRGEWSDRLLLYKRLGFQEQGDNYVYQFPAASRGTDG